MKKFILSLFVFTFSSSAFAQPCNCEDVFNNMVTKLKANYIGYTLNQNAALDQSMEEERKKTLEKIKLSQRTLASCSEILMEYLDFFKDGHLFVSEYPRENTSTKEFTKKILQEEKADTGQVKNYLVKNRKKLDGIEGVWTDGQIKYAIIKNNPKKSTWGYSYLAIILEDTIAEKTGEVKFGVNLKNKKYTGKYFASDYSQRFTIAEPVKDNSLMEIWGGITWTKLNYTDKKSIGEAALFNPVLPSVKQIDNESVLMTLPTFMADKKNFDAVINQYHQQILKAKYLLIDLRGNGGGNAIYWDLFKYYYEHVGKTESGFALSSEDNIAYFNNFAGADANDPYVVVVKEMKENPGKKVHGPKFGDIEMEAYPSSIQKVAIITDKTNISAAETFILYSKLVSSKVVTIGENTGGVVDYNNVNMVPVSCAEMGIYFGYPTFTFNEQVPSKGYNNVGISPDVKIPVGTKDKITFALQYLKGAK